MNKVTFEFDNNDANAFERFEIMEYIALTNDTKILKFICAFIFTSKNDIRRKRTKAERVQRAEFMGMESYKDIIR